MHEISFSEIVGCNDGVSVVVVLSSENSVTSESLVFQGEVKRRGDVLRGQNLDIRFLLLLGGEQCSPISEFCVRGFRVIEREALW